MLHGITVEFFGRHAIAYYNHIATIIIEHFSMNATAPLVLLVRNFIENSAVLND